MAFRSSAWFTIVAVLLLACQPEATSSGSISPDEFVSNPPRNAIVLDVRTPDEFSEGHIENAVNIPHDELASRIEEVGGETGQPIVVYCERGGRAAKAADILGQAGFSKVLHLEGDMSGWRADERPVARN